MLDRIARHPRLVFLAFGLGCFAAVGSAALLGTIFQMEVCSMCWYQRLSFLLAGTGFLLAAAWQRGQIVTLRIAELGMLSCLASAARQTWLMYHLDQAATSCGAGLLFYAKRGNWEAFFQAGLMGGLDCAENQTPVFGLPLPEWSLIAISCLILAYIAFRVLRCRARRCAN